MSTAALSGLRRRAAARVRRLGERLDRRSAARRMQWLQHDLGRRRPEAKAVVVADKQPTEHDVAIAERLLAAHEAAARTAPSQPDAAREDVWTEILARQSNFASILAAGDPRRLAAYLCNVSRHDAAVGITQGDAEYERIVSDAPYRAFVALMAKDKLVSLAEAVGALPPENPEQGPFGESIHLDPADLVARISARLGIDVAPPDVDGGLLKLDTGRGLFGERDANAIYTAHLLARTLDGVRSARVCEIGGGSGRVAYWSRRLGLRSYTLVDLPRVNVVQGYYALKSLPSDEVVLYGEQRGATAGERLLILPAHAIGEVPERSYDLVLNQDSFPEMAAEVVAGYLRWIESRCVGTLLSINHESKPPYGAGREHISVPELARAAGCYRLVDRAPYWLRTGYVVELYRLAPSLPGRSPGGRSPPLGGV